MAFGEPEDYKPEETEIPPEDWYKPPTELIPSEVEPEPNDWFETGAESGEAAPKEFEELPRFEEHELPVPEYQPYIDATHQRWTRENIILRERANTVLGRYQGIKADLDERKKESKNLRRQFNSVTEYVDVLTKFLEKLRSKTAGHKYAIYRGESPSSANASI
jgi:hypothetical protein